MKFNKCYNQDFTTNTLPDKSVQLIIADPPYFEVKGNFDFVWPDFSAYLADVERWAIECKRLLADNGTLFWYGHAKKIAYTQVIFDKFFNLENSIVWNKLDAQTRKYPHGLNSFAPVTERLLMYSNEKRLNSREKMLADFELFKPIKVYLDEWLAASGLSLRQAVRVIGSSASHYFGFSTRPKEQFALPTPDKYKIMASVYPVKPYQELKRIYDELREQYEERARFFSNTCGFTDVLEFYQESHITKNYNHDTQKPETLTRALILTCSRPGDLVFVPFAGSGTECAMAAREGRRFVGFDISKKYCDMTNERAAKELQQMKLF